MCIVNGTAGDGPELTPEEAAVAAELLVRLAIYLADGPAERLALRGAMLMHLAGRAEARSQRDVARLAKCSLGAVNAEKRRFVGVLAEIGRSREHPAQG